MSLFEHFFDLATEIVPPTDRDYEFLEIHKKILKAISLFDMNGFYLNDYYKKEVYMSDTLHSLFGLSPETSVSDKIAALEKMIPQKDLPVIIEMHRKWFDFLSQLTVEERLHSIFSYDFVVNRTKYVTVTMNHRLMPYFLTSAGDLWVIFGQVKITESNQLGNAIITFGNETTRYEYSFIRKKFEPGEIKLLTPCEKKVQGLTQAGFNGRQIANILCVERDTIKFHKKNIHRKVG